MNGAVSLGDVRGQTIELRIHSECQSGTPINKHKFYKKSLHENLISWYGPWPKALQIPNNYKHKPFPDMNLKLHI